MAHILVVDDHEDTREIFRLVFESRGHRVSEAGDGQEGLDVTFQDPPDLVILDLRLPVLNGWGYMERLRQDPRGGTFRCSWPQPTGGTRSGSGRWSRPVTTCW